MGTVIQYQQCGNADRHQRWDRIERAELGERYGNLQAQGLSQRQAAQVLDVPRSTLQAWRVYQESLEACPAGVAFFRDLSRERESSEQFVWLNRRYGETETQRSRSAITPSIRADSSQHEMI